VVRLAADGLVVAVQTVDTLGAGQSRDVTFEDALFKKGKHQLVATADLTEVVSESDEQNNTRTINVRCGKDD
jgi:subtilase family serine protease